MKTTLLEFGKYYHIYNCGINHDNIFNTDDDYYRFLKSYEFYINPIAESFSWTLMKNHFHVIIRIKEPNEIGSYYQLNQNSEDGKLKFQTTGNSSNEHKINSVYIPDPAKHFSHLFNSYAKYFNKNNTRSGSLFQRPFKRINVTSIEYLINLIVYIHTNPVHHGFTADFTKYKWTSYNMILSSDQTNLNRKQVIEWFGDRDNFIYLHKLKVSKDILNNLLLE